MRIPTIIPISAPTIVSVESAHFYWISLACITWLAAQISDCDALTYTQTLRAQCFVAVGTIRATISFIIMMVVRSTVFTVISTSLTCLTTGGAVLGVSAKTSRKTCLLQAAGTDGGAATMFLVPAVPIWISTAKFSLFIFPEATTTFPCRIFDVVTGMTDELAANWALGAERATGQTIVTEK